MYIRNDVIFEISSMMIEVKEPFGFSRVIHIATLGVSSIAFFHDRFDPTQPLDLMPPNKILFRIRPFAL